MIVVVRILRTVFVLGLSLFVLGGISLSPFVSLHQLESHVGEHGHRAPGHAAVDRHGHSHGDHHHPSLDVASHRMEYRLDNNAGLLTFVQTRPLVLMAACAIAHAVISRPPRPRPPLSLTTILRI
jgi:hypothetical protein